MLLSHNLFFCSTNVFFALDVFPHHFFGISKGWSGKLFTNIFMVASIPIVLLKKEFDICNYGTWFLVRYVMLLLSIFFSICAFRHNPNFEFIISLGKVIFHDHSILGVALDGGMSLTKIFAFANKTRKCRL